MNNKNVGFSGTLVYQSNKVYGVRKWNSHFYFPGMKSESKCEFLGFGAAYGRYLLAMQSLGNEMSGLIISGGVIMT